MPDFAGHSRRILDYATRTCTVLISIVWSRISRDAIRDIRPRSCSPWRRSGVTGHPDHAMAECLPAWHSMGGPQHRFSEQLTDGVTPHRAQKLYFSTASFICSPTDNPSLLHR